MNIKTILPEDTARRILSRHSTDCVPTILLIEIARYFGFSRDYENGKKYGILGFSKSQNECEEELIERSVKKIERLLMEVRIEFPFLSIREWYMVALSCYWEENLDIIDEIKNGKTEAHKEYIANTLFTDFSRKVCSVILW